MRHLRILWLIFGPKNWVGEIPKPWLGRGYESQNLGTILSPGVPQVSPSHSWWRILPAVAPLVVTSSPHWINGLVFCKRAKRETPETPSWNFPMMDFCLGFHSHGGTSSHHPFRTMGFSLLNHLVGGTPCKFSLKNQSDTTRAGSDMALRFPAPERLRQRPKCHEPKRIVLGSKNHRWFIGRYTTQRKVQRILITLHHI